ncbi:MAG TPA: hypothetical protein VJ813_20225 [Vicinamibacterales bacterium]|nr:hypothetical protein [Vicinamibacterales bacterium]
MNERFGSRGTPVVEVDCPGPIELILYITAQSPRSLLAIEEIKQALRRFSSVRVRMTLCEEGDAAGSGVQAMPPRDKRSRTLILGHITNSDSVLALLESCDGDAS